MPTDIAMNPFDTPKQPRIKFPVTRFGKKPRAFNPDWYTIYPWLEYSIKHDAAYCFACRMFSNCCNRPDAPFTQLGFRDWKHATGRTGRLHEHKKSAAHVQASITWEQYKLNGTTIGLRIDDLCRKIVHENRHFIKSIAEVILLCAKQEVALRGHDESEYSGNFHSLLKLVGANDDLVRKWLEGSLGNAKYTSPEVQNELLAVMGEMVLETICKMVQEAGC